jgi:hypothetical protein
MYRLAKNMYFMFINVFRKSFLLWDNVEKCDTARQARDDNMAHTLCLLDN